MRLAKYLAQAGVASRRAAESLIEQGRVRVDGALITTPVFFVEPGMDVRVDGEPVDRPEERTSVVYMLNKPLGVVSTSWDPQAARPSPITPRRRRAASTRRAPGHRLQRPAADHQRR